MSCLLITCSSHDSESDFDPALWQIIDDDRYLEFYIDHEKQIFCDFFGANVYFDDEIQNEPAYADYFVLKDQYFLVSDSLLLKSIVIDMLISVKIVEENNKDSVDIKFINNSYFGGTNKGEMSFKFLMQSDKRRAEYYDEIKTNNKDSMETVVITDTLWHE